MCDPQSQTGRNTLQLLEQKGDAVNPEAAIKSSQAVGTNQPLYSPLVEAQIIRLTEPAPGARDEPVVIRLFIAELEHHPEYDTISHIWGNPEDTLPILCNGRSFKITANLNAAFVRVRYSNRPRTLWADAACINQTNLEERSHHVLFMGAIYRNARTVLACLGQDLDGGAEDVARLVKENADLRQRVLDLENYTRRPNVKIKGVPYNLQGW